MNTFPPPTVPSTVPPRRPRQRGWITAGIVVAVIAVLGVIGAATNGDVTESLVGRASPGLPSSSGDGDSEILILDATWSDDHGDLCDAYNDVRDVPNIDNFMVKNFEDGYGQHLTAAGRAHLVALLHTC